MWVRKLNWGPLEHQPVLLTMEPILEVKLHFVKIHLFYFVYMALLLGYKTNIHIYEWSATKLCREYWIHNHLSNNEFVFLRNCYKMRKEVEL